MLFLTMQQPIPKHFIVEEKALQSYLCSISFI